MMRLYSVYAVFGLVTSSTMQHDKRSAEAVVRDSSERRLIGGSLLPGVCIRPTTPRSRAAAEGTSKMAFGHRL
jgi:hypothetical protein